MSMSPLMNTAQFRPEPPHPSARQVLPHVLRPEDPHDMVLSSLDLRDGLQVSEVFETLPADLWDLF